ncbi:hypothetical protein UA08_08603 [Talaromyces atroroseus]|uniref:Mitochondrial distribution and morphology protein 12 n=1 Tax=Talaromyces atroroseus TaxID=1441469 RepID=A0A225ADF2_TALAT|nr:hypothetical protein UA08_08603 [Talaromyces atroroseus]OKL55954.1 hypothetical protein UA08_08603 [Talaromyces atroroseus]
MAADPINAANGGNHDEPPVKRQKLDDANPTEGTTAKDQPAVERRRGIAPIKAEFLITSNNGSQPAPKTSTQDDDMAEGAAHVEKQQGEGKQKRRGQNTGRKFGKSKDEKGLCASRSLYPEFSPAECPFGPKCKFEHDLRAYLTKHKREDLKTFDGVCPVWAVRGTCPSGYKCRFVSSHMTERETDDGRRELVLVEDENRKQKWSSMPFANEDGTVNIVSTADKDSLRRRQVNTPKADAFVAWFEQTGKELDKYVHGGRDREAEASSETLESDAQQEKEDNRARYTEPPFLPSEKRRIYFGPETPALAPLTTQGNLPFRRLCTDLGAQFTYSEMAMGMPLIQGAKPEWALMKAHQSELAPPTISSKANIVQDYDNARDFKFGAQIAANKPYQALKATEVLTALTPHLRVIDLNCGCPIDLVYREGSGSALLDNPSKLEKILRGMNAVSGEIPITVKIRMGTRDGQPTALKLVERLTVGGADSQTMGIGPPGIAAITLHGRSRQQRYSRSADWGYISECAALVKRLQAKSDDLSDTVRESEERLQPNGGKIYFLGNGDCYSYEDYNDNIQNANVDSIMIGRGALIKPWLFEEIQAGQYLDKSASERLALVEKFARYGMDAWGSDEHGLGTTRRFLLEWLSFTYRYVPVGMLEYLPPRIQDRPPAFRCRNELETLLASDNYKDWIKITEMFLGPAHQNFKFEPKHKNLNWEAATSGPDGEQLAERIRAFIHDKFQQVPLPRFIRSVNVHSFEFGSIAPELEIKDICDPFVDFYEEDDSEDDEDEDEDEDEYDEANDNAHDNASHHFSIRATTANNNGGINRYGSGEQNHTNQDHLRTTQWVTGQDGHQSSPMRTPIGLGDHLNAQFRSSTPTILPGVTSNLGYHLMLGNLSGTQTPLAAAVAGGTPFAAGWSDAAVNGRSRTTGATADRHDDDNDSYVHRRQPENNIDNTSPSRPSTANTHPTHLSHGRSAAGSSSNNTSNDPTVIYNEHASSAATTKAHTLKDGEQTRDKQSSTIMTDSHEESAPHMRERRPEDFQVICRVKYSGDVKLSLTAEILLDYPMPSFVGLPLKLNITGITFDGVAVVAYIRRRAHVCFLSPEDADALVGEDENDEDHRYHRQQNHPYTTGSVDATSTEHNNTSIHNNNHGNKHPEIPPPQPKRRFSSLLQQIRVDSEIGRKENGKQALKNVGKVERFVLDQLRKTKCGLPQPCAACVALGVKCTFLNPQKKRGPAGHRLSQIRKQQNQTRSLVGDCSSTSSISSGPVPPRHVTENVSDFQLSPMTNAELMTQMEMPQFAQQLGQLDDMQVGSRTLSDRRDSPAWAETPDLEYWLPDSFASQTPSFGFSGSNIFVKTALPPIIDPQTSQPASNVQSGSSPNIPPIPEVPLASPSYQQAHNFWPSFISETSLIPWIDVYFDRLHPTLPVFNRSSLFIKIILQEHRNNPQFGAMVLSLCAFSLTQPIDISERPTSSSRADQARIMMDEATKMRSSSDFGENPTLEAVLTSFFLFGCLFGSNQHNAARLRLREALDLASTLGLNDPSTYVDFSSEEKEQWLRTYLVLSVTERAYALQRRHSITFTGRPKYTMRATDDFLYNATHSLISGIIVHNEKDAAGMMGLALLMEIFDAIDEEILICWNSRCDASNGKCHVLSESKVLSIYRNLARVSDSSRYTSNDWFDPDHSHATDLDNATKILGSFLTETQCADVLISQKWVQDRLWNLCLSHGLLKPQSEHSELRSSYAFHNAEKTLELCKTLRISAMEAHGIGIIEKLYNIATSAVMAPYTTGNIGADIGMSDTLMHRDVLARHYLKLLETLRGGNHPYTEQYRAQLRSMYNGDF